MQSLSDVIQTFQQTRDKDEDYWHLSHNIKANTQGQIKIKLKNWQFADVIKT